MENFVSCLFSPSQYILKTNYISFILNLVGYACFNNREGVDESGSFKLIECITFFNFVCYSAVKDSETAKLRDFFVMSDLSSAKQL